MEQKGFFGKIFDFSFEEFVTPTIIRVIYGILLVMISLGTISGVIVSFTQSGAGSIIATLIFVAIASVLSLILARVYMEVVIVIFRIAEPIQSSGDTLIRIEQLLAAQAGGATPPAPPPQSPVG